MSKATKYQVRENGAVVACGTRSSKRVYTHAVVATDKNGAGVYSWCGSLALATKARDAFARRFTGLNEVQVAGCGAGGVPHTFRIVAVEVAA